MPQNQIEAMSCDLLKPVRSRLFCIDFRGNKTINVWYYPRIDFRDSLSSMDDVIKAIDENCIKPEENPPFDQHPDLFYTHDDQQFKERALDFIVRASPNHELLKDSWENRKV